MPDLKTFLHRIDRDNLGGAPQQQTPGWILVPLTHHVTYCREAQERFQDLLIKGKALNAKALVCMWTTSNPDMEDRQMRLVREWTEDMGWATTSGQIRNDQHDGYLEGRSTYLIAADKRVIDRIPKQFDESNDGYHHLEQILDTADGIFEDCFSFFTVKQVDRKPSGHGAKIKMTVIVNKDGINKEIDVIDVSGINPA